MLYIETTRYAKDSESKLNIPHANYSLESFLEYIEDNIDEVFGSGNQRKWLKAHLIYTRINWLETFSKFKTENYGDITHIVFPNDRNPNEPVNFFAYQWAPGLVMMFTSSTEEDYERTLKNFIRYQKGTSESWIKPSIFEEMKNFLVSKHDAVIYRFITRRNMHWNTTAQLRPNYDRRISYSAEDAGDTLKEFQTLYGVIPTSVDMRVYGSKIQINRNGLFVIRHVNRKTIGVLQEVVDEIAAKQARIRDTSDKFHVESKIIKIGTGEMTIPRIVAGKITLPRTKLSERMIRQMFGDFNAYELGESEAEDEIEHDFSFIDTYVNESPFVFSASVIDEEKGTIFGVSGSESKITLIPKHRTTFESFISFYNLVAENFDQTAELTTLSEQILI